MTLHSNQVFGAHSVHGTRLICSSALYLKCTKYSRNEKMCSYTEDLSSWTFDTRHTAREKQPTAVRLNNSLKMGLNKQPKKKNW